MICEAVNKMLKFDAHMFGAEYIPETSFSVFDVVMTIFCTSVIVCFVGWWIVPLRWIGLHKQRFYCERKSDMRRKNVDSE